MTITELLNKYDIKHEKVKAEKGITLLKIKDTNVMFWINDNNMFKMKRQWFEILEKDCNQYILFLYDKKEKNIITLSFWIRTIGLAVVFMAVISQRFI